MIDNNKSKNGYIKLFRCIEKWGWYTEPNTFKLFIHCLINANHTEKNWKNVVVQRGDFLTSLDSLSVCTGLTKSQVRTALKNLKSTGEIACKTSNRNTIITVKNYNLYQQYDTPNDIQMTFKSHSDDIQIAHTKNEKNDKESSTTTVVDVDVETYKKESKNWRGEFQNVHLTDKQYKNFIANVTQSTEYANIIINALSEEIAQKNPKYPIYDEQYPDMHYIACRRMYKYRKTHPEQFTEAVNQTASQIDYG